MDYARLRRRMVEEQLAARGISDERVLSAFGKVERHLFIGGAPGERAYGDSPLSIGLGQTISQPYITALMVELLNLRGGENILEIGTGSGYQTAILAELGGFVHTIDRMAEFSEKAALLLDSLGYRNIACRAGDGTLGLSGESPFDAVIVAAAAPAIPLPLEEQLREGGRLVIPVGEYTRQTLILAEKKRGGLATRPVCDCLFVPLVGKYGWPQ